MSNNPLTNQTYINKDFQTIYPELLELVKKLTYKWDPTISNESDPGVLLIKLNAIIADKNNYNIDKNILECFPDTVTQYDNAYKLFAQLGYNMHWYRSAKGNLSFKWDSEALKDDYNNIYSVNIPQFTMLSDNAKEIVYTILEPGKLNTNGTPIEIPAIQGVIRDYTVGNNILIKATALDYRNRLYFPISNVAENGIFISDAKKDALGNYTFVWDNPDTTSSAGWKSVDNLYIQPLNTRCYKFGIDQSNNSCYIEFPNDITDLMGDGIFIKYIQSDGALGNIASKRISQFYEDVEDTIKGLNGTEVKVDISTNVKVANYSSITNGLEPEEIDDAYTNYQKTVGTFDTLVTLRDYLNYIVKEEFEQVSNGVVTDRTNDIQSSYEIVTTKDNETTIKPVVDTKLVSETIEVEDEDITIQREVPQMLAFDLKTYFLEYSQWPKFNASTNIEDQKLNFKKAYDKSFNLKLDNSQEAEDQKDELKTSDIIKKLYKQSKSIEHDFIPKLPCKPLIIKNKFKLNLTIIPNNTVTQSQADDIEKTIYEAVLKQLSSKNIKFGEEISYEQVYDICNNADNRVKAVALDNIEYTPYAVVYIKDATTFKSSNKTTDEKGTEIQLKDGLNEVYIPTSITGEEYDGLTFNEKIALEICAKNILAGTTPLYHPDDSFKYILDQTDTTIIKDIEKITTSSEIEFNKLNDKDSYSYMNDGNEKPDEKNSKMLDNESLFLYAPSLIDDITYSTSIKYIYIADEKTYTGLDSEYIPANRDYILNRGQHLFMFWKVEDNDDSPYLYARYGEGTILRATTRLLSYKDKEKDLYDRIKSELLSADYQGEGQIFGELNDKLKEISGTILSTNKNVVIKKINSVELADENNYCYWITNSIGEDPNNTSKGDQYKLTFKYIEPGNESIDASYQNGLMYISNFSLTEPYVNNYYSLKSDEKIYILKPIEVPVKHDYKNNGVYVSETIIKTNYRYIAMLSGDKKDSNGVTTPDKIKNTWNLYSADSQNTNTIFKKVNQYYSDNSNKPITEFDSSLIIPWGETEDKPDEDNPLITRTIIKQENELANALNVSPQLILKNGYKIDVVKILDAPNFGDTNDNGVSKFECLLKANEMFIYTDDDKKSLYILENGTKLILTVKNQNIKNDNVIDGIPNDLIYYCPIINKDGIYEDGVKAFTDDMWQNFKCSCTKDNNDKVSQLKTGKFITIIENQILSLGAGTYIRIKQNPIEVSNYNGENELFTTNVYDERFDNLRINSQGVEVASKNDNELTDSDWHKINGALSNYTIQYKAPGEDDYTTLPEVSDNSLSWNGYTILNINSGANKPQYLDNIHKQKFELYENGYQSKKDYKPRELPDDEGNNKPYLQTNVNMNLQGGENVDVTRTNIEGKTLYLDIMAYDKGTIENDYVVKKSDTEGIYEVRLSDTPTYNIIKTENNTAPDFEKDKYFEKGTDGEYDLLINEPEYWDSNYNNYYEIEYHDSISLKCDIPTDTLLAIEFLQSVDNITKFNVTTSKGTSGSDIQPLNVDNTPIINNVIPSGIYYYKLNNIESISFDVEYGDKDNKPDVIFTIKPLFKYEYKLNDDEDDKNITSNLLEDEVKKWDKYHKDGIQFDYTYRPINDVKINNPLNPKNYFNSYHKYNKFTIPQISDIKIKTMNKRV